MLSELIAVQVHQRCPFYFGSPEEVDKVVSFLA
jgi:fructose-1,6-bisphosphatase